MTRDDSDFLPFIEWLFGNEMAWGGALAMFLIVAVSLTVLGILLGYLLSAVRHGPVEAFFVVARVIFGAVPDLVFTSPRRTLAIARLAIQESIRRRVLLVAFALFALALLVGGWFLGGNADHPGRVYINFVMWGTQLLVLLTVALLSTFSLPTDIKNKTIYTIVTKPVRAGEIVLGRIVGFAAIGTVLLGVTGVISYFFVVRGLSHTHTIDPDELAYSETESGSDDGAAAGRSLVGQTSNNFGHRHEVEVAPEGSAVLDTAKGHTHSVTVAGEGDNRKYAVGGPQGMLESRVPIYGTLRFLDRTGAEQARGINVGNEWMYRSYIEGGSLAAAVWTFKGVKLERFLDNLTSEERAAVLTPPEKRSEEQEKVAAAANDKVVLPLELNLSVYRTYKGNIKKTVTGSIEIKHPTKPKSSEPRDFYSQEFSSQRIEIPRFLQWRDINGTLNPVDLFTELVDEDGTVEVWVRCNEPSQYFGAAQADVYIRARDNWFYANFFKGYISIWLQMLIVVALGVMFSTFLSSIVAIGATASSIVLGFYADFIHGVATQEIFGGGPIESLIRLLTQKDVMSELESGWITRIVNVLDYFLIKGMQSVSVILPDFGNFDTSKYVEYGFNIEWGIVARQGVTALGFFLILTVIGYFFLRTREIAA